MKLTSTQLRRIIREEVQLASKRSTPRGRLRETGEVHPDVVASQEWLSDFADSEELSDAVYNWSKRRGDDDWAGAHETVQEILQNAAENLV